MSQERSMQGHALPARRQTQISLKQLKRAPVMNVIGVPELVGLAVAVLLALIVIFAYFYFFLPGHSRLRSVQLERELLQGKLRESQKIVQENTSTRETVDKITNSLEDFESNRLAARETGRMSLYTTLNNLIRSNGLRNTAGPSYTTLEPLGTKNQVDPTATAEKQSNAKWQTIYPGIAVTMTVEGSYQNIWHFVRDIEASRHFLIINTIELENVTHSGAQPEVSTGNPEAPVTARNPRVTPRAPGSPPMARGALVSLRLDLATYFRRTSS